MVLPEPAVTTATKRTLQRRQNAHRIIVIMRFGRGVWNGANTELCRGGDNPRPYRAATLLERLGASDTEVGALQAENAVLREKLVSTSTT